MFAIHQTHDSQGWENLPSSAMTPKLGQALVFSNGILVPAAGTTKPTYISMCNKSENVSEGTLIPVMRVRDDVVFETTSAESLAAIKPGDKLTLSEDGTGVTSTTADGVAEVVSIENTGEGSKVLVRFA